MHSSFVEHMERNSKSHTVTNRTRRSERSSSNHYLAFECNRMQPRKTSKEKWFYRRGAVQLCTTDFLWPKGRRCQLSGQDRQDAESWGAPRGWNQSCRVVAGAQRLVTEASGETSAAVIVEGAGCCTRRPVAFAVFSEPQGGASADADDGPRGRTYTQTGCLPEGTPEMVSLNPRHEMSARPRQGLQDAQ